MKKLLRLPLILFILFLTSFVDPTPSGTGYKVGDEVNQDFRLKNIDGVFISPKMYKEAAGFIVVFTCNHCPYAKAYEERIKALATEFQSKGYLVLAINPNDPTAYPEDSYDSMKVRSKERHYTFPYLLDADQKVATAFGATKTPHVFVLQRRFKDDKLFVRYIGAIDDNYEDASKVKAKYVEDAVNSLLKHEYPKIENTKAIGCGIKWKKTAQAKQ